MRGPVAPPAAAVDGAGDQLLAGAGLAQQQHGDAGGRHLVHLVEDGAKGLAAANDLVHVEDGLDLVAQVVVLGLELGPEALVFRQARPQPDVRALAGDGAAQDPGDEPAPLDALGRPDALALDRREADRADDLTPHRERQEHRRLRSERRGREVTLPRRLRRQVTDP